MKRNLALLAILLLLVSAGDSLAGQKNSKKRKPTTKTSAPELVTTVPVRVKYTNGRELYGRITDINLKTVTIDAGGGNVITTSLKDVASLTMGETAPKVDAQFLADADQAYRALQVLATATEGNISFNEYKPKVSEAKRVVDAFISKYERNGPPDLFRTMRTAIRSFELVTPVWSLRVGAEQHKYVLEGSEQLRPITDLYPGLRDVAWKQDAQRYPVEKVIAWVWVQAAKLVDQSKQQIAKLR